MRVRLITSRANPAVKEVRGIKAGFDSAFCIVEGTKLLREALRAGWLPRSFWTTGGVPEWLPDCLVYQVPESLYRQLSPTKSGQSPLAVFDNPRLSVLPQAGLGVGRQLLLDQVQEPGNGGALVRAACAFGFDSVVWHRPCVFPFHHGCIRSSAGTVFHMNHFLLDRGTLAAPGLALVGAEVEGTPIEAFRWPSNPVLVMGNEGHGFSSEITARLTHRIGIPIRATVESLNVAGAAHILMYHLDGQVGD